MKTNSIIGNTEDKAEGTALNVDSGLPHCSSKSQIVLAHLDHSGLDFKVTSYDGWPHYTPLNHI